MLLFVYASCSQTEYVCLLCECNECGSGENNRGEKGMSSHRYTFSITLDSPYRCTSPQKKELDSPIVGPSKVAIFFLGESQPPIVNAPSPSVSSLLTDGTNFSETKKFLFFLLLFFSLSLAHQFMHGGRGGGGTKRNLAHKSALGAFISISVLISSGMCVCVWLLRSFSQCAYLLHH